METWETPLVEDWEAFLAPYYQAIEELKIKLKGIRRQYRQEGPCEDSREYCRKDASS